MKQQILPPTKPPVTAISRTPRTLIVTLLLLFPPLAWILMWRDKTYHHWFAKILFVSAGISIAFLLAFYFLTYFRVTELYRSLGLPPEKESLAGISIMIGVLLSLLESLYAWYVYKMTRNGLSLTPFQLLVTVIFLLMNSYLTMIGPLIIIQSIYRIVNTF